MVEVVPADRSDLELQTCEVGGHSDRANLIERQGAGNSDIEKVVPAGTLAVIAGTGTFGQPSYGGPATSSALYYPQGVAVDSAGDVYVADTDQFTIGMVSPAVPSNSTMPQVTGTAAAARHCLSAPARGLQPPPATAMSGRTATAPATAA